MQRGINAMQDKKIVAIELTSYCNLRCPQCPQGKVKIQHGFMKYDVFKKCLKHAEGHTELNWRGEPLLHPDLLAFIQTAKQLKPGLSLGIRTNANDLTSLLFSKLAEAGLNWLHVSLHNDASCHNYKALLAWNKELGSPLKITADAQTTAEELGALANGVSRDLFRADFLSNWGGYLTGNKVVYKNPAHRAKQCFFPRNNLFVVSWNGVVSGCCWDFEQRHHLGSVNDFASIVHKEYYELCKSCIWTLRTPAANEEHV
jgi:hypothetical protein